MSDTADRARIAGNGLEQATIRLKEGRIEDSNREMLATALTELPRLREQLACLQGQLDEANQALAQRKQAQIMLVAERDQYLRSLYALLPREWYDVSDEAIEAQQRAGGVPLADFLKEIEAAEES